MVPAIAQLSFPNSQTYFRVALQIPFFVKRNALGCEFQLWLQPSSTILD
jgi:hypothetical protein